MAESLLVDANCEIIIRDENLEDAGEIRNLVKFDSTLKLNEISSWQIDMHTDDYNTLNEGNSFGLGSGIMFRRDNVQVLSGPVMLAKTHYLAGQRTTTIFGGCDNAWLQTRVCYPKVEGMIYENGTYRFAQKRIAEGLKTETIELVAVGDSKILVKDATGFLPDATIQLGTGAKLKIATIDYPQNVINVAGAFVTTVPIGTVITQSGTGSAIVDDPLFLGYDVRTDKAETVMKELVYYNAGIGACVDKFGPRAIPNLKVFTNFGRGNTLTSSVRGENLLTQLQSIAISGQVNFQLKQVETDLVFDVFIGEDLTKNDDLVFSVEAGNLKEYEFGFGLPDANMLIGIGPYTMIRDVKTGAYTGRSTNKSFFPSADLASMEQFGRFEGWENASQGNAGDTPEQIGLFMEGQNQMKLLTTANNSSIAISLQETDQVRFPRDFNLGAKVVIMIGDEPTEQIVTNVNYSIPGGSGSGSAVSAFTKKQMSRVMERQNRQGDLIKQLMLNS